MKLGLNKSGYAGERIDISSVVRESCRAAAASGWACEELGFPDRPALPMLTRIQGGDRPKVYLSTGIHGDEPAGPLAVLDLLRSDGWPSQIDLWLCPCLNPCGFAQGTRTGREGLDLNREYHRRTAPEVSAHMDWLERQPRFDLAICLHEDWESNGFYLYELNLGPGASLSESIIRAVEPVCPIDLAETIEGRLASGGIIRPNPDPQSRPEWPEAFYLVQRKTTVSYTLESPSDFPLTVRVDALRCGVLAALETWVRLRAQG